MKKEKKESTILGIINIGGGASWYQSDDEIKCAFKCAKICKSDWKHLFKFEKKHQFPVNLFDLTKAKKGWRQNLNGRVYCDETKNELPLIKILWVAV